MAKDVGAFWDTHETDDPHQHRAKSSVDRACEWFGSIHGKRVLDLGCGRGHTSIQLARRGAHVTAVDISPASIEAVKRRADALGLPIDARVLDALQIDRLGRFDCVFGLFILHHVDPFQKLVDRLAPILEPGGRAFFCENNAVPLLTWFRNHLVGRFGVPKYGDSEEQPLSAAEIDMLRPSFRVEIEYPELMFFSLVSTYLLRGHGLSLFVGLDSYLYRHVPSLRRYSYRQYVLLERREPEFTA